jgi:hypothetical protein
VLVNANAAERLLLVIESKVLAVEYTKHIEGSEDKEEQEVLGQLTLYGSWLKATNPYAALVLLTHAAMPPDGFGDISPSFGVELRSVCRWIGLAPWMRTHVKALKDPVGRFLCNQLIRFLDKKKIREIDGAHEEELLRIMRGARTAIGRTLVRKAKYKEEALFSSLRLVDGNGAHVYWGLLASDNDSWMPAGGRHELLACVCALFYPQYAKLLSPELKAKLNHWGTKVSDDEQPKTMWWLKTKKASELQHSSSGFAVALASWAKDTVDDVQKVLK